jgi:transcriptional regulator of heat shock response
MFKSKHIVPTDRQVKLLDFIIREHVKSAKPVGSVLIVKKAGFKLSPATLRNEMNELEKAGYLAQLHTSGGRVPTDKAYRYYVNSLLENKKKLELGSEYKNKIKKEFHDISSDPTEINKLVARVLANLSENLVITGISQDKDFFKKGLVNLFENPEFKEFGEAFQLARFFEEFEGMFQFIEREFFNTLGMPRGVPVQIMIGKESPFRQIQHETVMCAKYGLPGNCVGSLTLVGPTRMDYEKNIALIKYITEELNKLIK